MYACAELFCVLTNVSNKFVLRRFPLRGGRGAIAPSALPLRAPLAAVNRKLLGGSAQYFLSAKSLWNFPKAIVFTCRCCEEDTLNPLLAQISLFCLATKKQCDFHGSDEPHWLFFFLLGKCKNTFSVAHFPKGLWFFFGITTNSPECRSYNYRPGVLPLFQHAR